MKFGLGVMQIEDDVRVLADLARAAEQAGWDGFFIWDRITLIIKIVQGPPKL